MIFRLSLAVLSLFFFVQTAQAGATEWIDIRIEDGLMYLETEIAGVAGLSIIDTGAQVNAINRAFLESEATSYKRGRSVKMYGAFSESLRETYEEIQVTVLGSPINFKRLVALDVGGPEIQLLLGASFLERYIFQFDYPNGRMRLITRDSVDLKSIKNVRTKRNRYGGSPLVRVGLNDKRDVWLTMDTGLNGGIIIDRDLARKLDWIDTYPTVENSVSGVNSAGQMEEFRVPSIQFGEFRIEDALIWIPAKGVSMTLFETYTPLGTRIASRSASKGLLGFDILQHFVVTIDYKSGHVHFYPGEKLPEEPAQVGSP